MLNLNTQLLDIIKLNDLESFSDYNLIKYEEKLSNDMQSIDSKNMKYDDYIYAYNKLHDELLSRGIVKFPLE
ncbi:hypothetical protein [Sulfurimonas sp.]|uniref:hypothetical protein n=1 Tax=Sulfurimonas sp. TaxID=2022749 RepID=UPI003D09C0DF